MMYGDDASQNIPDSLDRNLGDVLDVTKTMIQQLRFTPVEDMNFQTEMVRRDLLNKGQLSSVRRAFDKTSQSILEKQAVIERELNNPQTTSKDLTDAINELIKAYEAEDSAAVKQVDSLTNDNISPEIANDVVNEAKSKSKWSFTTKAILTALAASSLAGIGLGIYYFFIYKTAEDLTGCYVSWEGMKTEKCKILAGIVGYKIENCDCFSEKDKSKCSKAKKWWYNNPVVGPTNNCGKPKNGFFSSDLPCVKEFITANKSFYDGSPLWMYSQGKFPKECTGLKTCTMDALGQKEMGGVTGLPLNTPTLAYLKYDMDIYGTDFKYGLKYTYTDFTGDPQRVLKYLTCKAAEDVKGAGLSLLWFVGIGMVLILLYTFIKGEEENHFKKIVKRN